MQFSDLNDEFQQLDVRIEKYFFCFKGVGVVCQVRNFKLNSNII